MSTTVAAAYDDRHLTLNLFECQRQQCLPFAVGERVALAGVAKQGHSMHALFQKMADQSALTLQVQTAVLVKSRNNDRDNTTQAFHSYSPNPKNPAGSFQPRFKRTQISPGCI